MTPSTRSAPKQNRFGTWLARTALAVGLICAAAALLAGPGYRLEMLSLGTGIQTVRWAATFAAGAAVAAVPALVLAAVLGTRRTLSVATAALVVNVLVAAPP